MEETKEPIKHTDDVKDLDLSLNEKATVHQKFAEAEAQTDPEPVLEILEGSQQRQLEV